MFHIVAYNPFFPKSTSWLPLSTISPWSITIISSALDTDDNRWAIISVVLFFDIASRFLVISFSVDESSADVASSKK